MVWVKEMRIMPSIWQFSHNIQWFVCSMCFYWIFPNERCTKKKKKDVSLEKFMSLPFWQPVCLGTWLGVCLYNGEEKHLYNNVGLWYSYSSCISEKACSSCRMNALIKATAGVLLGRTESFWKKEAKIRCSMGQANISCILLNAKPNGWESTKRHSGEHALRHSSFSHKI